MLVLDKMVKEYWYISMYQARDSESSKIHIQTAVEQVTDRIINMIIHGELKPGDKLPNEAELSVHLGVGRNTIREAIKTLTAYGILESKRKEGTSVCDGYSPKLLDPLIYSMILNQKSNQDLIQLRGILENGIMHLAIEHATDEDIEAVQEQMREQRDYVARGAVDPTVMTDMDLRFHELIANCTHNEMLIDFFKMFNLLMLSSRLKNHKELLELDGEKYTIQAHQKLCDVLSARDMENADEAVAYSQVSWIGQFADEKEKAINKLGSNL